MTEKNNTNRKKKRVRIDYSKTVRFLAVLVLIVWLIVSVVSPLIGIGTRFDKDLIRAHGDPSAKAPKIEAESAVMYSLDLDRTVYEKNSDYHMEPYSITKMLTCYLALENLEEDKVVTASENAARVLADGTTINLKKGEKMKVIDLVHGAMLESGNDAATALAEAVSGSVKDFADLMNSTVSDWGCENTHFANANGWSDSEHYTTAADMAVIARKCLENETLKKISVKKRYTIPETNESGERILRNAFLKGAGNLKVLTGGKTGSWSEDDCTIALEFTDKGLSAVIVLLGDTKKGRASDTKALISFSHDVTPGFLVTRNDKSVCEAWVKHGRENRVPLYVKGIRYAYPANEKASGVKVKTAVSRLKAPVKKGDKAGKYYIYANKELVGSGVLYAAKGVQTGWLPSYLYISNSSALSMLLFMLLSSVLAVLLRKASRNQRRAAANRRRRTNQRTR